jgi:3-hydroxyisobutyrate dehydrogenase
MVCTSVCAACVQFSCTSAQVNNLVNAGYPVTVWNRNPSRCDPLVQAGAKVRCCMPINTCETGLVLGNNYSTNTCTMNLVVIGPQHVQLGSSPREVAEQCQITVRPPLVPLEVISMLASQMTVLWTSGCVNGRCFTCTCSLRWSQTQQLRWK